MRRRHHSLKTRSRNRAWKALSKKLREKTPFCEVCGSTKGLCCHHILEKRIWPSLWLEEKDLVVLCSSCHYKVHHHQAAEFFVWLSQSKPWQWEWIKAYASMKIL